MLSTPQGEGLNGAVRGPPGRGRKYVRGSKIPAPRARGLEAWWRKTLGRDHAMPPGQRTRTGEG